MRDSELLVYFDKFQYIIDNAKRIDYDWYNKNRQIIWIDDEQYKFNMYYSAYLATDVDGELYLYMDVNSTPRVGTTVIKPELGRMNLDEDTFRWLNQYISLNNMLWKVNRIYYELTDYQFKSCSETLA